jgi:hypothetical protein
VGAPSLESREPSSESIALSTHIRGHYASLFDKPESLEKKGLTLDEPKSTIKELIRLTQGLPAPDADSLSAADRQIHEFLRTPPRFPRSLVGLGTLQRLLNLNFTVKELIAAAASFQLLCILALGSPLLMRLTGMTCVSRTQRPPGRLRMISRWALGWIPLWGMQHALFTVAFAQMGFRSPLLPLIGAPLPALLALGAFLFPRNRCLLDRLAGTWKIKR